MRTSPAKEEITSFLKSDEPGMKTDTKLQTLKNAAQQMFTSNGLDCPVAFMVIEGQTIMLNRQKVQTLNGNH